MVAELERAVELALRAGQEVMQVYRREFEVRTKPGEGPVTEADERADRLIRDGLSAAFPTDAILSEETPDDLGRLDCSRVWLADPLDGTNQFVRRIDEFAVMIALAVEGSPVVGVVHLPAKGRTWAAARGSGCWYLPPQGPRQAVYLDDQPVAGRPMSLTVSRAHFKSRSQRVAARLGDPALVKCGSVGQKAMLVVDHTVDGYFSMGSRSKHWDTCAPECIVREAGGVFLDGRGHEFLYNTEQIRNLDGLVVCRRDLADPLLEAIAQVRAEENEP